MTVQEKTGLEVGEIKVVALRSRGVAGGFHQRRVWAEIVGRPFAELVRNVEGSRIGTCVLEIDDDDLKWESRRVDVK